MAREDISLKMSVTQTGVRSYDGLTEGGNF